MGTRRRARELALTVLFETEFHAQTHEAIVARITAEESLKEEVLDFLRLLVKSYADHAERVNGEVEVHSNHWKLSRMALVDRNILRLGVTEILFCDDIPKNVSINEYLEIAKKYGTEDSSSFVNGILDKIVKSA